MVKGVLQRDNVHITQQDTDAMQQELCDELEFESADAVIGCSLVCTFHRVLAPVGDTQLVASFGDLRGQVVDAWASMHASLTFCCQWVCAHLLTTHDASAMCTRLCFLRCEARCGCKLSHCQPRHVCTGRQAGLCQALCTSCTLDKQHTHGLTSSSMAMTMKFLTPARWQPSIHVLSMP